MIRFDQAVLDHHGLTTEEYDRIVRSLGREPTETELGIFSVMWSEHCSYKSSRVHLKKLPTRGARVLQGPGENAGAVDIGDGLAAVFKIESHNHPSFIEPYQGAATGVGGIIRDIFTMGARPIALLNSLRFGPLDDQDGPRTRRILEGVVSGIAGYGNSIGIPTVGGEIGFEPSYSGNPLVNVLCLGITKTGALVKGRAAGIGNPVYYAYGWEKLIAERLCIHYREDYDLDTRIVRFHNIFGPLGTWDGGREKAPAAICRKVATAKATGESGIEIWGDGEQTRSFCYIDDCLDGLMRLMASDHHDPLNLGQDRLVSINQLADMVCAIAGVSLEKRHVPGPQGVRGRNSDNSRLRQVLGWQPQIPLEEGLARTYQWVEAQVRQKVVAGARSFNF